MCKCAGSLLTLLFFSTFTYGQKPNILWITIEDTSPQFVGSYGNKSASTPVMDQLAREGVRFTDAFSTGTVCSPSRFTIITGVRTYAAGTGHHRSQFPVPDFVKGFPFYLQKEGYYVTNNSKTDYNLQNEKAFIEETWHENSNTAGWWNRKPGQPFFSVFNFNDSHQSRTMTHAYSWYEEEVLGNLPTAEHIGDNDFEMPPFYRDSPEMRKQVARVYNSLKLTDNKIGLLLGRLKKDGLMDNTIIFFFGDHGEGIPRGKTNGINLGYRVPFVVWFPSKYKHLSPWGTGTVSEELVSFEDLAPTMVSLAGGAVPEHLMGRILIGKDRDDPTDRLFLSSDRSDNGLDMVRTVTDGRYVYSKNFMPFMPQLRYIRYMEIGEIKQQMREDLKRGLLNPLQQSLFEARPAEYLYDIQNDPWEIHNLAEDSQSRPVMEKMRTALKANVLETRDVMFLPEYALGQIAAHSTPYQFRLDREKYPLQEILEVASLAGIRGEEVTARQVQFLQSKNDIIRHWAALGLRSQKSSALKPYNSHIMQAMEDSYPPVQITASAIAYDLYKDKDAEEILKRFSKNDNKDLALMAINYLLYVQDKEPFIETMQAIRTREDVDYAVSSASKDFLGSLGLFPNDFEHR